MKPLNRYFNDVARPALEKFGFAYAELLREWPRIAGDDVAAISRPHKLRWPRAGEGGKKGATLHLRVAPGRALELQHMQPVIVERINAYYGYAAVERLVFVQAPLETKKTQPNPSGDAGSPVVSERLRQRLEGVTDPDLRESLRALASAIRSGPAGEDGEMT